MRDLNNSSFIRISIRHLLRTAPYFKIKLFTPKDTFERIEIVNINMIEIPY